MHHEVISQDRKKEMQFWDDVSKRIRIWIENASEADLLEKINSNKEERWWEGLIGKIEGKNILDIGCGNTYFAAYWQLSGNEATGSDFSAETVANNKLLHRKLGLKDSFYVASSEKIQAEDNSLDVVHMRWVIHHIPPELQDSSMREIMRVLKPGGRLMVLETTYDYPFRWIVQTPIFGKLNFLRNYAIKKKFLDPEEKALSNKGYINLLERNGFKLRKVDYDFTFISYPVALLVPNKSIEDLAKKVDTIIRWFIPKKFSKDIKIIAEK